MASNSEGRTHRSAAVEAGMTPWDDLAKDWAERAGENIDNWGYQELEVLLLAAQEELGELTQAVLEAEHEGGDPARRQKELGDLAALMFQIQWVLEHEGVDR